jgi:3-oxoacyl-[acyl-carrier protein] reductase
MILTMGPEPGVESHPDFDPEQFPPRKISPLVVWRCTEAAANINGRTFHVGGDEVSLLSEPAPERTVTQLGGWDLDASTGAGSARGSLTPSPWSRSPS